MPKIIKNIVPATRNNSGKQGAGKRIGCILLAALTLFAMAAGADDALPHAPGRHIDVGSHKLHIQCSGKGNPTVILEAGLGGLALEWTTVQSDLAQSSRVCSYDRAGMGWSEFAPGPRTSRQITEELHQLLENAGLVGPYILVGHSFGGYTVQLFARRFPKLVAGMVLVDSSHPEQVRRFAAPPVKVNIAPKGKILHLLPVTVPDNIAKEIRDTAEALAMKHKSRLTVTRELEGFRRSADQVAEAAPLPEIPLIVLTRGQQKWRKDRRGNLKEALWRDLQAELAGQTRSAIQIIARHSGHHIHLDQPELVSHAVRLVDRLVHDGRDMSIQPTTRLREAIEDTLARFEGGATLALMPRDRRVATIHP